MAQLKDTIINGSLTIMGKSFLDWIYPKGSYYWTSEETFDPNTEWKIGTWERVQDKMLMAKGTKFTANGGHTDGTLTLTTDQLPKHNHSFTPSGTVNSDFYGTAGKTGSGGQHRHTMAHTHTAGDPNNGGMQITGSFVPWAYYNSSDCKGCFWQDGTDNHSYAASESRYGTIIHMKADTNHGWTGHTSEPSNSYTGYESSHTHSFTPSGTVSSSFTGTSNTTGYSGKTSSVNINIMPPYEVAYCWKRTA